MSQEQKSSWLSRWRQFVQNRQRKRWARRRMRRRRWERNGPWIWRHCPENKRKAVFIVFIGLWGISLLMVIFATMFGMVAAPLVIATENTGSLLSLQMRWYIQQLKTHLSRDSFGPVYVMIQLGISFILVAVITYSWKAMLWMGKHKPLKVAKTK